METGLFTSAHSIFIGRNLKRRRRYDLFVTIVCCGHLKNLVQFVFDFNSFFEVSMRAHNSQLKDVFFSSFVLFLFKVD